MGWLVVVVGTLFNVIWRTGDPFKQCQETDRYIVPFDDNTERESCLFLGVAWRNQKPPTNLPQPVRSALI